jgi:hypothetical protein
VKEIGDIVRAVEAGDAAANACSTHVRNAATTGLARMEETEGVTAVR